MIIRKIIGRPPGPTDLTWEERNTPSDYLHHPVDLDSVKKSPIKNNPEKTWAHPGDIECQETDTGVLLTIRQPKNTSFAIRNEKGLLLQIFIDPDGKKMDIIKNPDAEIEIKNLKKSDGAETLLLLHP